VRKDCTWIQENTERDYSQTEYGKNVLVVGDGGNGDAIADDRAARTMARDRWP
jgi:hypothetical protein